MVKIKSYIIGIGIFVFVLILFVNRERFKTHFVTFISKIGRQIDRGEHCSCSHMNIPRDGYASKHRVGAIRVTKNGFILNDKVLQHKIKSGKLIPAQEADGYWLQNAPNSSKYLTPLTYKRLRELGQRFRSKLAHTANSCDYFVISSITRTEDQQEVIRKKYPNQATMGTSTHSYGVSFDIAELITKADCKVGTEALTAVLGEMQNEGKILLCPESTCMHVTVIK